ncbi:MAG: hemolysin III family protein [Clostridia bacterium]|nr:hemolysin III family protein [Clostridia bacterium]
MKKEYDKSLPKYTKGEEIFNAVTHIVGGGYGIIFLIVGVIFAHINLNWVGILSMYIYGFCMIITYTMSAIYHFLRPNRAKKVFRIFDHCSIFLLIAGTYTPYCLITLAAAPTWGYTLFALVWALSILGIVLNAINMHKWKKLSMVLYLALGWCVVIAIVPLLQNLPMAGFWWLLGGGIAYTVGAIFYGFGSKIKYIHSVWHLFVLLGSILQFVSILFYVVM